MKSKEQQLLEEAYEQVSYKSPFGNSPYGKKDSAAHEIFTKLLDVFDKLTNNGDKYVYEDNGKFELTKKVDDKGHTSLYWGRVWQGQTYGRSITKNSVEDIKQNQQLLNYLTNKL